GARRVRHRRDRRPVLRPRIARGGDGEAEGARVDRRRPVQHLPDDALAGADARGVRQGDPAAVRRRRRVVAAARAGTTHERLRRDDPATEEEEATMKMRVIAVVLGALALTAPAGSSAGPARVAKEFRMSSMMTPQQVVTLRSQPWKVPASVRNAKGTLSGA